MFRITNLKNFVKMSEQNDKNFKKLINEIKYLLTQFPDGLKFMDFAAKYLEFYGKALDPQKYGCQNYFNLFTTIDSVAEIKKYKFVHPKNVDVNDTIIFSNDIRLDPYIPESIKEGVSFEIKVENMYDLSKFWIVAKILERDVYEKHLSKFYSIEENCIHAPKQKLMHGMLCIYKDQVGKFHRAVVNNQHFLDFRVVRLFLLDSGIITNATSEDVYYMHKQFTLVPRFSIRATLAYLAPYESGKTWSIEDVRQFWELIARRNLLAYTCLIEKARKVLHIAIRELCGHYCDYINKILRDMKLAKSITDEPISKVRHCGKYLPKVKFIYLFPSIEAIEAGAVPKSLNELELLKNSVPQDYLFRHYYEYDKEAAHSK